MKRSEAIKHIVNVLRLTGNHYCDDGRDEQDAEKILKRLEQLGMLPPSTELKQLGIRDNAWEPEANENTRAN
jgi:hypothetical protein